MIKMQDKRENATEISFEPKDGERTLLSCDNSSIRSPSLDSGDKLNQEENELLNNLVELFIEAIIWKNQHAKHKSS